MTDQFALARQTRARVLEVLETGPATPAAVIEKVISIDDRLYTRDRVRRAINTLLNWGQLEVRGGQIVLTRKDAP